MTTATATAEGQEDLNGTGTGDVDVDTRVPTDSILTGQEGDEAVDDAEVEAAMAAGFKRAKGTSKPDAEEDITDVVNKKITAAEEVIDGDEGQDTIAGAEAGKPVAEDDPDIPGLGMKASAVKAALAEMETLRKSVASTSGHLGHLKQLVQQAGQGKKVTAESLKRVSEEFGADFASAMADDLNAAGFGAGVNVDQAAIEQMMTEKLSAGHAAMQRDFEKKLVARAHPDADDHFARQRMDAAGQPVFQKDKDGNDVPVWDAGPKNAAFMAFVATLPKPRQEELFSADKGWDSGVVTRALDEFKAAEKKAATTQATQQQRIARAAVPKGRSGEAQQPAVDPVMQGWNNVRGKRAASPNAGRGR